MARNATTDDGAQETNDAQATTREETVAAAVEDLRGRESLAETPFSMLFHEARTSSGHYSGVTVQVRVRDGTIETSDPVRTRQGQHLRGTDAWDGKVSLPTRAFMEVQTARQKIVRQLRDLRQAYSSKQ